MTYATSDGTPRSTSVCVRFPSGQCPDTVQDVVDIFARFGSIARVDLSLGCVTDRLSLTFFDIRAADRVLHELQGRAERSPGEPHDVRSVSIPAPLLAEMPDTFGGFQGFGEIAGVSTAGEDLVVEFYDMRAAQRASHSVQGCRLRLPELPQRAEAGASRCKSPLPPTPSRGTAENPARVGSGELLAAAATTPGSGEGGSKAGHDGRGPRAPPVPTKLAPQLRRLPASPTAGAGRDCMLTRASKCEGGAGRAAGGMPSTSLLSMVLAPKPPGAGPGKPPHAGDKVKTEDFGKFDIDPEKIRSGADTRTTVMVRKLSRECTRGHFLDFLARCGLEDRYDFFYMPFVKRKKLYCGFAFINFKAAHDVLALQGMIESFIPEACHSAVPPALSYARLQGQQQLMEHFCGSNAIRDADIRKRPQFLGTAEGAKTPPQAACAAAMGQLLFGSGCRAVDAAASKCAIGDPLYVHVPDLTESILDLPGAGGFEPQLEWADDVVGK